MVRKLPNPNLTQIYLQIRWWYFSYVLAQRSFKKFLRYINSRYRNIQFTSEGEPNGKISFLDISIIKSKNELVTSIYGKKTFSIVYMNYITFLATNYKKALIDTLLFWSSNIWADYSILHTQIKCLKTIRSRIRFHSFLLIIVSKIF